MMNMKAKKSLLWGALMAPAVFLMTGGYNALAAGPHGHGPGGMGQRGGG